MQFWRCFFARYFFVNILINLTAKKVQTFRVFKVLYLHLRSLGAMLQRCVMLTQYTFL